MYQGVQIFSVEMMSDRDFIDLSIQGAAKMGALFSAGSILLAVIAGKVLRIKRITRGRHEKKY